MTQLKKRQIDLFNVYFVVWVNRGGKLTSDHTGKVIYFFPEKENFPLVLPCYIVCHRICENNV